MKDGDYTNISKAEDNQVVAHHVFDKNAPKLSIKMSASIYDVRREMKKVDDKEDQLVSITRIKTDLPNGEKIDSYAYVLAEKEVDGKEKYVTKSNQNNYYEISFNKDGKFTIGNKVDINPETDYAAPVTIKNQHFTLVIDKFVGEGETTFKNELEGGNIYAINLKDQIEWSKEFGTEYSPDENIGGEEHETNKESVIYVTATVKEWTRNEVHVQVN